MKPKKLTPLEILHRQKIDLQTKSGELSVAIENHAKYLQRYFVPLLRESMVESVVSKMPSRFQNLAGHFLLKGKKADIKISQSNASRKVVRGIAIGVAEIAPFFLKGKKGAFFSFLLKQVVKWVRI